MSTGKLILLNLSNSHPELTGTLKSLGWDIQSVNSTEALSDPRSYSHCLLGLALLNKDTARSQIEQLPLLCPVPWLAVIPAAVVATDGWAPLLAQTFCGYLMLPVDIEGLSALLDQAQARLQMGRNLDTDPDGTGRYGMIGRSPPMQELFHRIARVTRGDEPVLITGESGTGKGLVARALHEHSKRRHRPFVVVNCGGLAERLLHSELFGHEQGAFTGAHQRRIGSIEAAAGGVVFLDGIGDLPLPLQSHLLRFLQEKAVVRFGSSKATPLDVRVVAATHVDLLKAATLGRFREDLLYRLNVTHIPVPPLRQRGEDIELLAQALLGGSGLQRNPRVSGIGKAALTAMRQHHWPGNVRELINRMQHGMIMSRSHLLTPEDLDLTPIIEQTEATPTAGAKQRIEREMIRAALEDNRHNVSRTARALGVSRVTLYRLFEKFDIERA